MLPRLFFKLLDSLPCPSGAGQDCFPISFSPFYLLHLLRLTSPPPPFLNDNWASRSFLIHVRGPVSYPPPSLHLPLARGGFFWTFFVRAVTVLPFFPPFYDMWTGMMCVGAFGRNCSYGTHGFSPTDDPFPLPPFPGHIPLSAPVLVIF